MKKTDNFDFIKTLVYDSEHSAATVEEAYEKVSKLLKDFALV